MSFDLVFVTRAPGQSWEDAHEALGEAGEPADLTPERRALWDRIVTELAPVLPKAESVVGEEFAELDDEATGLQLSLYDSELALSVPYWHSGEEADRVVALLTEVVHVIERDALPAGRIRGCSGVDEPDRRLARQRQLARLGARAEHASLAVAAPDQSLAGGAPGTRSPKGPCRRVTRSREPGRTSSLPGAGGV